MVALLIKFDKKLSFFLSILQIGTKLDINHKKIYTIEDEKIIETIHNLCLKRGDYEFK